MTNDSRARVAWVSPQLNHMVASTRYRCYYPAISLGEFDIESVFYGSSREVVPHLKNLDAIVFVKLLDSDSLRLAGLAKDSGVKVFIDLCDNIVVANYPMVADFHPALRFAGIGAFADAVVVPSSALAEALQPLLRPGIEFVVIPDQIETIESVAAAEQLQAQINLSATKRPISFARRALRFAAHMRRDPVGAMSVFRSKIHQAYGSRKARLFNRSRKSAKKLSSAVPSGPGFDRVSSDREPRPKSVVWFGNFGAQHSDFGMLALLLAAPALESVCLDTPLELVVISNKKAIFDSAIAQINVPTRYVEWSTEAVFQELRHADVCLLPFGMDVFSATKSANRAVLALQQGVPVVTSRLRSMEPLEGVVVFDDWESGLRRFLGPFGATERAVAIAAAIKILANTYSSHAIGKAWATLIGGPTALIRPGYIRAPSGGEVAVMLEDSESIELLMPIVDAFQKRSDVLLRVLVTPNALAAAVPAMIKRQIVPYALEGKPSLAGDDRVLRTVDWLFAAAGSERDADSMAASIVRIAQERGVNILAVRPSSDLTREPPRCEGGELFVAKTADALVQRVIGGTVDNVDSEKCGDTSGVCGLLVLSSNRQAP